MSCDPEAPSGFVLNPFGLHRVSMEQIVEVYSEIAHRAVVLLMILRTWRCYQDAGTGCAVGLARAIESYRKWEKCAGDNSGNQVGMSLWPHID